MAEYDGSIRINTQIITDNARKDIEKITQQVKDAKDATAEANRKQVSELELLIEKANELRAKKKELKEQGSTDTEEYNEVTQQWEAAEEAIQKYMRQHMNLSEMTDTYKKQLDQLRESGYGFGDDVFDEVYKGWKNAAQNEKDYAKELDADTENSARKQQEHAEELKESLNDIYRIKENAVVSDQRTVDLMEELTRLQERQKELKAAGVTAGYQEYDQITARLKEINQELKSSEEEFDRTADTAKKGMKEISKSTDHATGFLGKFAKKIKTIAITAFIFSQIRKVFRRMVAAIKEGFNNVIQYSNEYNKTMSELATAQNTFKNSIGAAFSPLLMAAVPALTTLINYLTMATNAMNEFIAMMQGASTWTKAVSIQQDYAKSLNKTAASAKAATKSLASFDTIEVLNKKDTGGEVSPSQMFTEEKVDMKPLKIMDEIVEKAKEIADIFKEGFVSNIGDGIEDRLLAIKESAQKIWESMIDIVSDNNIVDAVEQTFENMVYAAGQVTGTVAEVATTIGELFVGGISTFLDENSEWIKEKIASILDAGPQIMEIGGNLVSAVGEVLSSVFGGESAQNILDDFLSIFSTAYLTIGEIISNLVSDIFSALATPIIENKDKIQKALEGILAVASVITGTISESVKKTAEKITQVYNEHFKPFFDSVQNGLTILIGKLMDFWAETLQPVLDKAGATVKELWEDTLQPLSDKFFDVVGQIGDMLTVLWENVIMPLVSWLIENALPKVADFADKVIDHFKNLVENISDTLDTVLDVLSGVIEFLTAVFMGDWDAAWEKIGETVDKTATLIKKVINTIISAIETLVNVAVDAINAIIDMLNAISFEIPSWLPNGGEKFGFDISHINHLTIPKLADGAVLRGGNPFMAILGDQPHGQTNIEAPLATIEQAVANAMGRRTQAGGQLVINMQFDGETFARLSMDNWMEEANRRGYDIDVLGGMA